MAKDFLTLKPEEFASLPVVKAYWSHNCEDYDIWLTARRRSMDGLLWIFECPHGRWLLVGDRATVHWPSKKKWNQGVIKLPPKHKKCQYTLFPESAWEIVVDDPLKYFETSDEIRYKANRWYYGDIDVYLKAYFPNFRAILFITLQRRMAHVTFDFFHLRHHQFEYLHEPFEVDYEKALQLFHHLQQENCLKEEEPIYPPLYVSYIAPNEALKALEGIYEI